MHLRVIQNIAGYYGIINTYPLPNDFNPMQKKTITLIEIDGCYHPVVSVPGGISAAYETVDAVSKSGSEGMVEKEKEASSSEEEEICGLKQRKKRKRKRNRKLKKPKKIILVPEEVIIISDQSDGPEEPQHIPSPTDGPPDGLSSSDGPPQSQDVKVEEEEDDDIPPCPQVIRDSGREGRLHFDMRPFWGMIPEVVSKVPHNINGLGSTS